MQIIRRLSDNLVMYAGADLSQDEIVNLGDGWCDERVAPGIAEVVTVGELPAGFIPDCWTFDGAAWSVVAERQEDVNTLLNTPTATVPNLLLANIVLSAFYTEQGLLISVAELSWDPIATATLYEVRYRKTTDASWLQLSVQDATAVRIEGLLPGKDYLFSMRARCQWGLSAWSADVPVTAASTDPAIPGEITFTEIVESLYTTNTPNEVKSRAKVTWTGGSTAFPGASLVGYDLEAWGPLDTDWTPRGRVVLPQFTLEDTAPGFWRIRVRAVNSFGQPGGYTESQIMLAGKTAKPNSVTGFTAELVRGQLQIAWLSNATAYPESDLDVIGYSIQLGTSWDAPENLLLVDKYAGTAFSWTPTVVGSFTLLIKAIDSTGNYSENATALNYSIATPSAVPSMEQRVIDNIVQITWGAASPGSFPIAYYEVRRGLEFSSAELVTKADSTSLLMSELNAGTYKYWVRAVDSLGTPGPETGIYTTVDQPPDYVLRDVQNLVFAECTVSNGLQEGAFLYLPVNTTLTFEQHFTANPDTTQEPWASPQDQVNDGYLLYGQPGKISGGTVERIIDYTGVPGEYLPATKVSMNVTRTTLAGTLTVTPEILHSLDGVSYTSLGETYTAYVPQFRFIKYRLTVTTSDGGLLRLEQINVKLDVKQRRYVTSVNVTDTVSDGTQVTFASLGLSPNDVLGITAEAPYTGNSTNDPIRALVNFQDTVNPTSFKVLAYNKSNARVAVNGVTVTINYI